MTALETPGTLELDGVDYAYPGADDPVLHDVSFSARPGQTIAVIGSTGSGKSTMVNLVPRLFDATAGEVRIGGVDVRRLDPDLLWGSIGLVPQRAFLFSGTIRSNLQHGSPDATEDDMWEALEIAQARDFVATLAEGLDAPVSQGGTNFSGGQRQRLAIARALIRKPGIYLFDDSFSALDLSTDARLRAALRPVTRESTVVIVAQRVSTIRDADLILVLEDGVVVGRGTHEELLADSPTYQEIVESQLSAEEARRMTHHCPELKKTERIQAGPGPGRGPFGGGMVGQKAMTFGPSAKRLIRRMAPEKVKAVAVISLAVVSVALTAFGPKILGHATDLIFAGFAGEGFPDGLTKQQAVDAVRANGDGKKADMLASMDFVPGRGVDFSAVANVLLLVLGVYVAASLLAMAPGVSPQRRRPGHGVPDALGGGGQGQRPSARLLRPAAAR